MYFIGLIYFLVYLICLSNVLMYFIGLNHVLMYLKWPEQPCNVFYVSKQPLMLRVFENRVLGKVFGPKRDEVTREWRKLHNEKLNDRYSLPNIVRVVKSRRMRWAWHVARMGDDRGVHKMLVGKPEGQRPLGRPRRRWEDNIKMDLQEVGLGRGDWMELAQDRAR